MNIFAFLWQVIPIILSAGAHLTGMAVGAVFHTTDAGIPPAVVTLADGKRYTVELHITRVA